MYFYFYFSNINVSPFNFESINFCVLVMQLLVSNATIQKYENSTTSIHPRNILVLSVTVGHLYR